MASHLAVRDLHAGYESPLGVFGTGRHEIISGVDFLVRAGEVVALIAPNGAGKSTIMRAIVAKWTRWSGEVLLGNDELDSDKIAWLPQNPALTLSPWRKVWQEAAQPLLLHGLGRRQAKAQVENLMRELGFNLPLDRRVDRLSGGQKVRVAVMRALCLPNTPGVFVLDEPMEGLDAASRATLVHVIKKIASKGVPVLLTSHRLEDLYELNAKGLELIGNPVTSVQDTGLITHKEQSSSSDSIELEPNSFQRRNEYDTNSSNLNRSQAGTSTKENGVGVLFASILWGCGGLLAGIIVWKLGANLINNAGLLPAPEAVFFSLRDIFVEDNRIWHVLATILRSFCALILAALFAIPIGVILGYDARVYAIAAPWIAALRGMPILLLVGVAAGIWPNLPELQRLTLVVLTIFVIGLQIMSATAAVAPRRRIELTRILGGRLWHRLSVLLYEVVSGAFAFLEVGLPLAILATILVETLLIPHWGLGKLANNHLTDRDLSLLFALITLPGIVGALGTWCIRWFGRHFRYES